MSVPEARGPGVGRHLLAAEAGFSSIGRVWEGAAGRGVRRAPLEFGDRKT